jgi:hypothetical protein
MTRLLPIPILALVATALLTAGCGSSDDSTLSRAEFLKQADAICWETHNRSYDGIQAYIEKHPDDFSGSPASARVSLGNGILVATVPALEQGANELEALAAPEGESQKVEKFIAATEKANRTAEENPHSEEVTSAAVYRDSNKLAREYDFGRCAALP